MWVYQQETFSAPTKEMAGFVYLITNILNNKKYVGRKYFWKLTKIKGKSRRERVESDWKKYYGSSPELTDDIKLFGKENFHREILSIHSTKGATNYEEVAEQFRRNVLYEVDDTGNKIYYNKNILGRYFCSAESRSNKTYEEYYGEDRAAEIKDKQIKKRTGSKILVSEEGKQNKIEGLKIFFTSPEFEEKRQERSKKISEKLSDKEKSAIHKQKLSEFFNGKTYEELYGEEKAEIMKSKLRGKEPVNKGKTYEELYGEEKSKNILSKISEHGGKTKNTIKINDGIRETHIDKNEELPSGWSVGRLPVTIAKLGCKRVLIKFKDNTQIEYSSSSEVKKEYNMSQHLFENWIKSPEKISKNTHLRFPSISSIEYIS